MGPALIQTDYRQTQRMLRQAESFDIPSHVRSCLARGLPELAPSLVPHDGTFVVVGSGPSVTQYGDEIRAERAQRRPICAINGAYDWLVSQGITPSFFLTVDPRPMPQNVTNPQPETVFLLSSRCAPSLFDRLADYRLVTFHSYAEEERHLFTPEQALYGGGSTSGLRAVSIGYLLGFAKFVLYGMDSCLAADGTTKRFTGEQAGQTWDRWVNGRRFWCNGAMALQADEFQTYYQLPDLTMDVKGDGLLAAIVAERKRLGKRT